ncbi:MAG: AMP-binding protein [Acidimicrobiales bacterium]
MARRSGCWARSSCRWSPARAAPRWRKSCGRCDHRHQPAVGARRRLRSAGRRARAAGWGLDRVLTLGDDAPPGAVPLGRVDAGYLPSTARPLPADVRCILYTSGSTATPTGVQHSHEPLPAGVTAVPANRSMRTLATFPAGHIASLLGRPGGPRLRRRPGGAQGAGPGGARRRVPAHVGGKIRKHDLRRTLAGHIRY